MHLCAYTLTDVRTFVVEEIFIKTQNVRDKWVSFFASACNLQIVSSRHEPARTAYARAPLTSALIRVNSICAFCGNSVSQNQRRHRFTRDYCATRTLTQPRSQTYACTHSRLKQRTSSEEEHFRFWCFTINLSFHFLWAPFNGVFIVIYWM